MSRTVIKFIRAFLVVVAFSQLLFVPMARAQTEAYGFVDTIYYPSGPNASVAGPTLFYGPYASANAMCQAWWQVTHYQLMIYGSPDYSRGPIEAYNGDCYQWWPSPNNPGAWYEEAFAPVGMYQLYLTGTPQKNAGSGDTCTCGEGSDTDEGGVDGGGNMSPIMAGDPINVSTGNKFLQETDYSISPWLIFRRFYNSSLTNLPVSTTGVSSDMGAGWSNSFNRSLMLLDSPLVTIGAQRPDGRQYTFHKNNGVWASDSDVPDTLSEQDDASGNPTSFTLWIAELDQMEVYNASGLLQSVADLNGQGINLAYSTASTPSTIAPSAGLLLTVTDSHGRQLNFAYNGNGEVSKLTLPDGGSLTYTYDSHFNLTSVTYPDGKVRTYTYNALDPNGVNMFNALTGIVDEAGVAYESTTYSGTGSSSGRAASSSFAGGVGAIQVAYGSTGNASYDSDGTASIQFPLGKTSTITAATEQGVNKVVSVSQSCGRTCSEPFQSRSYDANGYPSTATDWAGHVTATSYDTNGLLDQEVGAQGTVTQRTTKFTWNTNLRVPLARTVQDASGNAISNTQWVYNAAGQTLARCDIDPTNSAASGYTCSNAGTVPAGVRRWTYAYCAAIDTVQCPLVGLMLTATGPRTDLTQITTYSYYMSSSAVSCSTPGAACYQAGDLHTITDALGHVTTIASYDADGRITRMIDTNGVNTDLTYTPRGWLASRTVGGAQTSFTYTAYGNLQTITDPDGVITTFGYDAAHRLIKITDALGNYIQYTLDAASDKTAEQVYDSSGTLHRSLTRTFNTLGQLTSVLDGLNHTVFSAATSTSYDANGNLIQSSDGLNIQRQLGYDALNRLVQMMDNYGGTDTATQNTKTAYQYDSLDRLTQVTDPGSLSTTYGYNGLSDATGQVSPDTGTTSRTFDAAGNVRTSTDAKGITATNTYDVLDRLISTSYPDSTQNVTYSYDDANSTTNCSSSYPIGRLTRIIENSVITVYCYDARGNVIEKQQVLNGTKDTTGYAISSAGRPSSVVYPSGTQVSYIRDGDGRIQSVSVTPSSSTTATTAVNNVTYQPFGPISGYTLGNGQAITRVYDANYRLTDLTSAAFTLHLARDIMGDVTAIGKVSGANPATETYSYDPLYRLTTVTEAGGSVLESVTYNQTGDRLTKTASGLDTGSYTYAAGTHQLTTIGNQARTVDADGNTTAITQASGTYGFGYSNRDVLTVAQLAGSTVGTYAYNALRQRISKIGSSTVRYDYDEAQHLVGEHGAYTRDYVWMDDIPVAVVDVGVSSSSSAPTCFKCIPYTGGPIGGIGSGGSSSSGTTAINYVYADGLGTPRAVANSAGTVIWQWAYQGNPWGEVAPTATSSYALNLRFSGQYYDQEAGLIYNANRYYEAPAGRYVQSDPTGLQGGINTYVYVDNNSLDYIDPFGLDVEVCRDPAFDGNLGPIDHYWLKTNTYEAGMGTAVAGANAGNQYDPPISRVETVDHTGRSKGPNAECKKSKGADESIVDKLIKPGRPLGHFIPPFNYCHSFVIDVLHQAHGEDPFANIVPLPQPPAYIPGYGPQSSPSQ